MQSLSLRSFGFWGSRSIRSVIDHDDDHHHHHDHVMMIKRKKKRCLVVVMAAAEYNYKGKFRGTQMREKQLTEMIEKKVKEAKEVCEGDEKSDECKVAWDEVEEISQAKADFRLKLEKEDPLESFCQENPETDECRLYDN